MCRQVTCRKCGMATWSGCGQHVDQVMRGVPKSQHCTCGQAKTKASAPRSTSQNAQTSRTATAEPSSSGFFSRLLGR